MFDGTTFERKIENFTGTPLFSSLTNKQASENMQVNLTNLMEMSREWLELKAENEKKKTQLKTLSAGVDDYLKKMEMEMEMEIERERELANLFKK